MFKHAAPQQGPPRPAEPPLLNNHRNTLAGLWAAELLGLFGQAASDYVKSLAHFNDREQIVQRLTQDLAGHATIAEIRRKLRQLLDDARW